MKRNQKIIIIISFLIIMFLASYFWHENQTLTKTNLDLKQKLSKQTNNNNGLDQGFKSCIEALTLSDKLTNICSTAYSTIGNCLTHMNTCNYSSSMKTLEQLNESKEVINNKLNEMLKVLPIPSPKVD